MPPHRVGGQPLHPIYALSELVPGVDGGEGLPAHVMAKFPSSGTNTTLIPKFRDVGPKTRQLVTLEVQPKSLRAVTTGHCPRSRRVYLTGELTIALAGSSASGRKEAISLSERFSYGRNKGTSGL
jgi:hypothetical protein